MKLEPVSKSEAARYMGVKGAPEPAVAELLDTAEKMVRERTAPKYVWRVGEIVRSGSSLSICGVEFIGESVKKHLSGCDRAVLLAATLSAESDKLIRQTAVTDMALSLAVDCICSAAVEQVCNRAESEIFSTLDTEYRTWRFSPGYGDLPIDVQRDFLNALNAPKRIGLTVTESSLLLPTKSVTAVIGISDIPVKKGAKGCAVCSMRESCAFRAVGGVCGGR